MAPIGLQLFTVRDQVEKHGYETTIRQVAEIGYRYVETAGFPTTTPENAAKLFKELGIQVLSAHIGNPVGDAKNEILETMEALGKPRLIIPWLHPDLMKTSAGVKELCDALSEGAQNAKKLGIAFGYHNHYAEFGKTDDGQYVYQLMQQYLAPEIFFELDTYWIKVAGLDPADVIKELGSRAPLLHIKDGPVNRVDPMKPIGEGAMDWPKILKAGESTAEYWIVEMDRVDGDSLDASRKSYQYLKNIKI